MRSLTGTLLIGCLMAVAYPGCSSKHSFDFNFIDNHLVAWDRFAQGANELAPQLKANRERFEKQLAAALEAADRRAPSRLVFYAVVQVAGFIRYDSDLGRACEKVVGTNVPIFT